MMCSGRLEWEKEITFCSCLLLLLLGVSATAYAGSVTLLEASPLVQGNIADTDAFLLGQFVGFQANQVLTYTTSTTNLGWLGSLAGTYAGQTLDVAYTGDFSKYSSLGVITWTSTGLYGSTPWSGTGSATVTGTESNFQVVYNYMLTVGTHLALDQTTVQGTTGGPGLVITGTSGDIIIDGIRVTPNKSREYSGIDNLFITDIEVKIDGLPPKTLWIDLDKAPGEFPYMELLQIQSIPEPGALAVVTGSIVGLLGNKFARRRKSSGVNGR